MMDYKALYEILNNSFDDQCKVEKLIDMLDDIYCKYSLEKQLRQYYQGSYRAICRLSEISEMDGE